MLLDFKFEFWNFFSLEHLLIKLYAFFKDFYSDPLKDLFLLILEFLVSYIYVYGLFLPLMLF